VVARVCGSSGLDLHDAASVSHSTHIVHFTPCVFSCDSSGINALLRSILQRLCAGRMCGLL